MTIRKKKISNIKEISLRVQNIRNFKKFLGSFSYFFNESFILDKKEKTLIIITIENLRGKYIFSENLASILSKTREVIDSRTYVIEKAGDIGKKICPICQTKQYSHINQKTVCRNPKCDFMFYTIMTKEIEDKFDSKLHYPKSIMIPYIDGLYKTLKIINGKYIEELKAFFKPIKLAIENELNAIKMNTSNCYWLDHSKDK